MKFKTRKDAELYRKCGPLPNLHKTVKSRYWSMDQWDYVPCWTVVLK